jgi:hypothetical protein
MLGAFANVLLFLVSLMGTVIIGAYVLGYAARCLLVVVQETGAGAEELSWPEEPTLDWLGQSIHVAFLPLLVLAPVGFLVRGLRDNLFPNDPGLRFLVLAVPALWLLFPVALLSSLASASRWNVLRPVIVARLARLFPATATFYLLSAVMATAAAAAWYFTLFLPWSFVLLPVAAILTGLVWLVYGRVLGRVAWLIGQLGPVGPEPKEEEDTPPAPKKRKGKKGRAIVTDPWAVPEGAPEPEPGPPLPVEGYDLSGDAPAKPPPLNVMVGDVSRITETPTDRPKPRKPKKAEPRPAAVSELPLLSSLFRGLPAFPWSGKNGVALMRLSIGFLALGGGLKLMLLFLPF